MIQVSESQLVRVVMAELLFVLHVMRQLQKAEMASHIRMLQAVVVTLALRV